jgi:hypothetical protein
MERLVVPRLVSDPLVHKTSATFTKIPPFWISALEEPHLLLPPPAFPLFFSRNRIVSAAEGLKVHKFMDVVATGESRCVPRLVLDDSAFKQQQNNHFCGATITCFSSNGLSIFNCAFPSSDNV